MSALTAAAVSVAHIMAVLLSWLVVAAAVYCTNRQWIAVLSGLVAVILSLLVHCGRIAMSDFCCHWLVVAARSCYNDTS